MGSLREGETPIDISLGSSIPAPASYQLAGGTVRGFIVCRPYASTTLDLLKKTPAIR